MFLLIRKYLAHYLDANFFTFHNVSINTRNRHKYFNNQYTLHSTMFLLIPGRELFLTRTDCTLHSTMFLLIPLTSTETTFQMAPLHSTMFLLIQRCLIWQTVQKTTLHSTMFLLIRLRKSRTCIHCILYIPQCFY